MTAAKSTPTERLNVVDGRLDAIERALGLKPSLPKAAVLARLGRTVIEHKATTIFLSIALCGIGIYGKYYLDHRNDSFNDAVDVRIDKSLKAPGGVLDTLGKVQTVTNETNTTLKTLQPFIQDLVSHQFENVSKLSVHTLGERLPAVKELLAAARDQNVQINPAVVDALRQNLLHIPSKPADFWPAAAEFVNYRSTSAQRVSLPKGMPNCTDSAPHPQIGEADAQGHMKTIHNGYYENCKFTIDSTNDDARINFLLTNGYIVLEFRHCLIVYNGGPFSLVSYRSIHEAPMITPGSPGHGATVSYSGPTLEFIDCKFDFSVSKRPSTQGQELLLSLLKETEPAFSIPFTSPATQN